MRKKSDFEVATCNDVGNQLVEGPRPDRLLCTAKIRMGRLQFDAREMSTHQDCVPSQLQLCTSTNIWILSAACKRSRELLHHLLNASVGALDDRLQYRNQSARSKESAYVSGKPSVEL